MEEEDIFDDSILTISIESPLRGSTVTSSIFDSPTNSPTTSPHHVSLMHWFDKSVEQELAKRRNDPLSPPLNIAGQSGLRHPLVVESIASGVDITGKLKSEQDTELLEAVEKFAKAEAMVAFEGAVKAAEEAASSVPPEYAEVAAAEGARGFQAELTSVVKEVVPGVRPIEVVGYVGITRPRRPRKP